MRRKIPVVLLSILVLAFSQMSAQETIIPTPIDESLVSSPPFSYNGIITAAGALGSGSVIDEGVVTTAAHVVYNEDTFFWIAASSVRYFPQFHESRLPNGNFPVNDTYYTPVALYRWAEYSTRVQEDQSGPGLSTPNTFNLDFAVGYFSAATNIDALNEHPELHIDEEGEVSILRHPRVKTVVGYPQDSIPVDNEGLMHQTQPADYKAWDAIYEDYDSGNLWASVYNLDDVTTYSGNSGGPIYVRDDLNNWMMAGVIDGSNGSSGMLVRAIDENAYYGLNYPSPGMILQAINARNGDALMRVEDLQVSSISSGSVELFWTDVSSEETGYTVFRQQYGTYVELADLAADSSTFVDDTVLPGQVYHYMVQPYEDLTNPEHRNKAPKSRAVAAQATGLHEDAVAFLGTHSLNLMSTGDSSWFVDGNNKLRAGVVRSMGSSSLVLNIFGPGTITFDWTASCEENEEYSTPGAQYEGDIYDSLWLYMDGSQVMDGDEPVFLSGPLSDVTSGLKGQVGIQLNVPAGAHEIEWRYEKDPYTDEHQDTGFLDALYWVPDPTNPYPVYGAYPVVNTSWHASEWFGMYDAQHLPWIYHEGLGWLYLLGGTSNQGLYFHCSDPRLGALYTSPEYWPFLHQPETGSWFYYFDGANVSGGIRYLWDFDSGQLIMVNN